MWETFIVLNTRNRWESNCRSGAANFTRWRAHAIFNTVLPEWRNWQTQQTQNLPGITPRVGSTPSSGTILLLKSESALAEHSGADVLVQGQIEAAIDVIGHAAGILSDEWHGLGRRGSSLG